MKSGVDTIVRDMFNASQLKDRIVSLILHGSFMYLDDVSINKNHDIDLELILENEDSRDLKKIKKVINAIYEKVGLDIECQLRYIDEITNEYGIISNIKYKIFMYFAYSNGLSLIGRNIYKDLITKISEKDLKKSYLISLQIHYKDIRKMFLRKNYNLYLVKKNIMRFFGELCFFEGLIQFNLRGSKVTAELEKGKFFTLLKHSGYLDNLTQVELGAFEVFCYEDTDSENEIDDNVFSVVKKIHDTFTKRI